MTNKEICYKFFYTFALNNFFHHEMALMAGNLYVDYLYAYYLFLYLYTIVILMQKSANLKKGNFLSCVLNYGPMGM